MDYSRNARELATELSDRDVAEGLAEANRSRRRENAVTTSWIGLPAALKQKMIKRTAAGLGVDEEWDVSHLCAVVLTICGALLTFTCSVVTAIGIHSGGLSWKVGLLWALSLGALVVGARAWRTERKSVDPELALTHMEQLVVRGYLVAPPNLLQPTDPGNESRLAALAALASSEIRLSRVREDDRSLVEATRLDLDRTVVCVYELAYQIREARAQISSTEAYSDTDDSPSASAEVAGALDSAESGLELLVTELCAHADSLLQVDRLLLDEERLASVMDPTVDVMINDLLASAVTAEYAARDLNTRRHEVDGLKDVFDRRRTTLIGSWPDHVSGK